MAENWTLPAGNRGDCEDYALLKKKLLIERGVPAERLLLAVVIKGNLEPHVVLLFRGEDADYLLDNMTDAMLPWRLSGYTVVKMQSAEDQSLWSAVLLGPLATRQNSPQLAAGPVVKELMVGAADARARSDDVGGGRLRQTNSRIAVCASLQRIKLLTLLTLMRITTSTAPWKGRARALRAGVVHDHL